MNIKRDLEDLQYLADEIISVLRKNRSDVPEDLFKIISDLVYHTKRTLKEMEIKNEKFNETRNDSLC